MPPKPKPAQDLQAAYHQGPPEIHFAGRLWRRGDPQSVTPEEWRAMQARADCAHFDFRTEAGAPPAPDTTED